MFLNCTNHKTSEWSENQKKAALLEGEILDFPFPTVSAEADELEIENMAHNIVEKIIQRKPNIVLCQGEFTLTYSIVSKLIDQKIRVVSACSERKASIKLLPDGNSLKEAYFEFIRFREYGKR